MTDHYLNSKEVALMLGITPEALRRWRYEGKIGYIILGHRTIRYEPQEVQRLIQISRKPAVTVAAIDDSAFYRGRKHART